MKTITKTFEIYTFDELSEDIQKKLIENKKNEMYEFGYDSEWLIEDDYLLEPEHAELEKLFKKYKVKKDFILIENSRKLYYSLDRDYYIDIKNAMIINDNFLFLKWLNLTDKLIEKINFTIESDYIIFESYEKISNKEQQKLDLAAEKFQEHCRTILKRIESDIDYYFSDESISEELINSDYEYFSNGDIYKF